VQGWLTVSCNICQRPVGRPNIARHRRSHSRASDGTSSDGTSLTSSTVPVNPAGSLARRTFIVNQIIRQGVMPRPPRAARERLHHLSCARLATVAAMSDSTANLNDIAMLAFPELTTPEVRRLARLVSTSFRAVRSVYISRLRRFVSQPSSEPLDTDERLQLADRRHRSRTGTDRGCLPSGGHATATVGRHRRCATDRIIRPAESLPAR